MRGEQRDATGVGDGDTGRPSRHWRTAEDFKQDKPWPLGSFRRVMM